MMKIKKLLTKSSTVAVLSLAIAVLGAPQKW